jgi:hypothetical protein
MVYEFTLFSFMVEGRVIVCRDTRRYPLSGPIGVYVTPGFKELNQVNHMCAQEVHTYVRIKKYQKQCYLFNVHIAIITLTSEYRGTVTKLQAPFFSGTAD